jgi:hypothetical protein
LITRGGESGSNSAEIISQSKNPIDPSSPSSKKRFRLDKPTDPPRRSLTIPPSTFPLKASVTTFGKVIDSRTTGTFFEEQVYPYRLPQSRANVFQGSSMIHHQEQSEGFGSAQNKEVDQCRMISHQPLQYPNPSAAIPSGLDLDRYPYGATASSSSQHSSRSIMVQSLVHSMLQGGAKAETIGWVCSGAVSLPDLKCVLETYSGACSSLRAEQRELPFQEQEDIIALVGNATSTSKN